MKGTSDDCWGSPLDVIPLPLSSFVNPVGLPVLQHKSIVSTLPSPSVVSPNGDEGGVKLFDV